MPTYKFRVLLDNSDNEEIFRDIEIDGNHTFEDFYHIVMRSFYFKGDQMASFYVSNLDWDKGEEIALFDMGDDLSGEDTHLMNTSNIKSFTESENQRFILVYDFLKMWCFLIELVEVKTTTIQIPEITLSIGISPKEDSREMDFDIPFNSSSDLGNDIDDIFSEFEDEDEDNFGSFENIDDLDI